MSHQERQEKAEPKKPDKYRQIGMLHALILHLFCMVANLFCILADTV